MINKEDIKVGTLVKKIYYDFRTDLPLFKVYPVSRVNDKSFKLEHKSSLIRYEESQAYSVLTNEEYEQIYNNALNNTCQDKMVEVRRMVKALSYLNEHIEGLIALKNEIGVEFTIDPNSVLNKIDDMMDCLKENLGAFYYGK